MSENGTLPSGILTCFRSVRFASARLFTRWFESVRGGKHIVVVVVSESAPGSRHWVITAYIARKLAKGDIEWKRN